jgi:hypothetical protein
MTGQKDVQMTFRIEAELRAAFSAACDANHVPAAQQIRQMMRDYVKANAQPALPLGKGGKGVRNAS